MTERKSYDWIVLYWMPYDKKTSLCFYGMLAHSITRTYSLIKEWGAVEDGF
ncbi:MAG: hypothetical protein HWN65_14455 [Candidatus Helarchaeota archaeon]|nr:hypothetical protein [Candidatus Helarchaeota archaeon]